MPPHKRTAQHRNRHYRKVAKFIAIYYSNDPYLMSVRESSNRENLPGQIELQHTERKREGRWGGRFTPLPLPSLWCLKFWMDRTDTSEVTLFFATGIPPSVTVIPKAATVAVHGSVTFTCKAKGDPSPMLTWYTNGVKISKGAPGYIISGESLTLLVVQWSDQGSILCEATNTLGSKSDGASLTVVSGVCP